jgi:methylenetetrahydrofolate dehydrogenase (NADP+)/methenyltetrahydrofolate cyclohydrolase
MKRLAGRPVADAVYERLRREAPSLPVVPSLVVLLVGDDPASQSYVAAKEKRCRELGFRGRVERLPATVDADTVLRRIAALNADRSVHGILVQLPLPPQLPKEAILEAIDPEKDVDGLHPLNAGRLFQGRPTLEPCTPAGVMELLRFYGVEIAGRRAVVIGRSDIVGKPMAQLLLRADATVTVAHSKTPDLAPLCREADILVAAAGRPKLIGASYVKPGATIVDVGIHRTPHGWVGDVDAAAVASLASALTPVPGGVGVMTIAMLMRNVARAARAAGH